MNTEKNKFQKLLENKWFHIALILIGTIFILAGAFHSEVWFDEAYTMALIDHDYQEIIDIDSRDVHPILYYLLLKTVTLVFGNSILVCRLFSVIAGILIGVLGYTHIRKDFGAKVGVAFTFLSFFLPFMATYAMEIRMYTWTMLFVALAGIYAYRITKKYSIKNWILFAIFSLGAAHCHYYGLATVAIINGLLFLYILFSKKMYENQSKKKYIITFLVIGLVQILGYLPWLFIFLKQVRAVSNGYWIPMNLGETVAAPLGIQFNGRLNIPITVVYTVIMYAYLIYQIICTKKQKQKNGIIYFCLLVHFILYFLMLLVSVVIKPIMYHRYMLVTIGMFMFPFAYFLVNNHTKHQKIISSIIVVLILGLGIYNNIIIVKENYPNTMEEVSYIKQNYKEGDIILYQDYFHGSNLFVQLPEYNWYLYHIDPNHDVVPYENFSPPLKIIFEENFLDNYDGRIIIVDHGDLNFYNSLKQKYEIQEIDKKIFNVYRDLCYHIVIIEK